MSERASGHTDWQAPAQRGLPVVDAPTRTEAVPEAPAPAPPPPRPRATGWSPTSWRRKESRG